MKKELFDYKVVNYMYFDIESGYVWGEGMPKERIIAFDKEFTRLFADEGWRIEAHEFSGSSYEVYKGDSHLYLHPMTFSGPLERELIPEVEGIIDKSTMATLIRTRHVGNIFIVDDKEDELHLYHLANDERCMYFIKEYTATKRRNLYVRLGQVEGRLRAKFNVDTNIRYIGYSSGDSGYRYIYEVLKTLLDAGYIIGAEPPVDDDHLPNLIRWANSKELKYVKPINDFNNGK